MDHSWLDDAITSVSKSSSDLLEETVRIVDIPTFDTNETNTDAFSNLESQLLDFDSIMATYNDDAQGNDPSFNFENFNMDYLDILDESAKNSPKEPESFLENNTSYNSENDPFMGPAVNDDRPKNGPIFDFEDFTTS